MRARAWNHSEEHAPGSLLLAFRTGQLNRAYLEIRALALSYMQCQALTARGNRCPVTNLTRKHAWKRMICGHGFGTTTPAFASVSHFRLLPSLPPDRCSQGRR